MQIPSLAALVLLAMAPALPANPPVASYIFPSGGQRGTQVAVRVGGLFLHGGCGFEMRGLGVQAPAYLKPTPTRWFEGPLLPLPDSQRAEDYPKDMAGMIRIAAAAPAGVRYWRLWTSQGATPALQFVIGELPEVVEEEIDGNAVPVRVQLPVTINGRIFPRENVDVWTFYARQGQAVLCEVQAARLGSPLDARLEVLDPHGKTIAENDDDLGPDPRLRFIALADGLYQVRIRDTQNQGGPAYVYRLTLTTGPHIDYFFPLGGQRGSKVTLEVAGQALPDRRVEIVLPDGRGVEYGHHVMVAGGQTNEILLDMDDLPEHLEGTSSKPIAVPAVFNGRIRKPGAVDSWRWSARKGETFEFELRAARLGSRLDGVLSILDAGGKELERAETTDPGQLDPRLRFMAPADGIYCVQVRDRFRSRGGLDYAYRLRVDQPKTPDFILWLGSDALTVPRKGQAKVKISADRLAGFKEPIQLKVEGLPLGVSVSGATIPAGHNAVELLFKADEGAKVGPAHLTITGVAKVAERELAHRAALPVMRGPAGLDDMLLVVAMPTPFEIKGEYEMGFAARGSVRGRKYKILRHGYGGPIEVSLADRQARHLQGVTSPTITVPAGANEFTYSALLPPWMETGRTCRVCVMGVGLIKEADGTEHHVSFSSVNQNEQLVAVVGPGNLAVELAHASLSARPGKVLGIPVRIKRSRDLRGSVDLEIIAPPHMKGLNANSVTIAADREQGEIIVHCSDKLLGPFNMPITVRATLMHQGKPHIAEAKLDIQP